MKNNEPKQLGPDKTAQVIQLMMEGSAKDFVRKWNEHNPADPVDIRFVLKKVKVAKESIDKKDKIKAQAILNMELRRNFNWEVLASKVLNFKSVAEMERSEVLLTLGLWSDMFADITHMGFIAGISNSMVRQQTKDHKHYNHEHPLSPSEAVSPDQATDPAHG